MLQQWCHFFAVWCICCLVWCRFRVKFGFWPDVYASMRPGLCSQAPGDFLHLLLQNCCHIMRIWSSNAVIFLQFGVFVAWFGVGFVLSLGFGPKFMRACVQGHAHRRPVSLYICCCKIAAISCAFGPAMVSFFCSLVYLLLGLVSASC